MNLTFMTYGNKEPISINLILRKLFSNTVTSKDVNLRQSFDRDRTEKICISDSEVFNCTSRVIALSLKSPVALHLVIYMLSL